MEENLSDEDLWWALKQLRLLILSVKRRTTRWASGSLWSEISQVGNASGWPLRVPFWRRLLSLILDDSTSALDYLTEARLLKSIKEELSDTSFDLEYLNETNSLKSADQILVLNKGTSSRTGESWFPFFYQWDLSRNSLFTTREGSWVKKRSSYIKRLFRDFAHHPGLLILASLGTIAQVALTVWLPILIGHAVDLTSILKGWQSYGLFWSKWFWSLWPIPWSNGSILLSTINWSIGLAKAWEQKWWKKYTDCPCLI